MSFAQYKKNRKNTVQDLAKAAEEAATGKKNYGDDRYWKPTVDKDGNAQAVIRFLPAKNPKLNENPWVILFKHGFKGPTGQWYFELSRTTIGEDDPVGDLNTKAWAAGDKQSARDRKRKLVYVSNIYVVSDPGNPENEGKVFLYEYGKKIFEKLKDAMTPEFEDETPINPFDLFEGANFKLRQRKVEGWPNYDKSELGKTGSVSEDEAEMERIFESMYELSELIDPKNFKSYEELQVKLNRVLCITSNEPQAKSSFNEQIDEDDEDGPDSVDDEDGSDDDSLKYFQNMVDD
jgi:hypothetical protein